MLEIGASFFFFVTLEPGGGFCTYKVRIDDCMQTLARGYGSFQALAEKYKLGGCRCEACGASETDENAEGTQKKNGCKQLMRDY